MLKVYGDSNVEWLLPTDSFEKVGNLIKELRDKTEIAHIEGVLTGIKKITEISVEEEHLLKTKVKNELLGELKDNYTEEEKSNLLTTVMNNWQDVIILLYYSTSGTILNGDNAILDWRSGFRLC